MSHKNTSTYILHDRGNSPKESFPLVYAILDDDRFSGAKGRTCLRKLLGTEHEKSTADIPGMRGSGVWRFALTDTGVILAPFTMDIGDVPTVFLLGPTAKVFPTMEATLSTTGDQARIILEDMMVRLHVKMPAPYIL
jgi:hypothetical protein